MNTKLEELIDIILTPEFLEETRNLTIFVDLDLDEDEIKAFAKKNALSILKRFFYVEISDEF